MLAVALVPVTASAPPLTTATPRRPRRSPPRVLFLECADSCTCVCLLRAPAPGPTIDADQGPAPRPGVSVATGMRRMPARPPDHSIQPARAGEIAKVQSSSIAKTQPAPHPAITLILAWTLPRSCTPSELQPAPVLPPTLKPADGLAASTSIFAFLLSVRAADTLSKRAICTISGGISDAAGSDVDAAGPTRRRDVHDETTTRRIASQPLPYPCRRLHGSFLARSGAAIPSSRQNATPCYPQESRTASCKPTKTPADRPAQHRAALRFTLALASLDLGLCLGRPSAQTAATGSLRQRQHLLPPQSVQVFRTPAAA